MLRDNSVVLKCWNNKTRINWILKPRELRVDPHTKLGSTVASICKSFAIRGTIVNRKLSHSCLAPVTNNRIMITKSFSFFLPNNPFLFHNSKKMEPLTQ